MQGTIAYDALDPRERSVIDAFQRGEMWSPEYYAAWCKSELTRAGGPARLALDPAPDGPLQASQAQGGNGPEIPAIQAAFIRDALLSRIADARGGLMRVDERGAHLSGARIEGTLDLTALEFGKPVSLESCIFEKPIVLREAKLGRLSLNSSTVPAVYADMAEIEGDLWLCKLQQCETIQLRAARIRGSVDMHGTELSCDWQDALSCNGVKIGGSLFLRAGFKAQGGVDLIVADIGISLDCDRGEFHGKSGPAILCDAATIGANVFMRNGFKAVGEVHLRGATIKGQLACVGGEFTATTGDALGCEAATIGADVFLSQEFKADGKVSFIRAKIGGSVYCQGGTFKSKRDALDLEGSRIEGTLYLTSVRAFEGNLDLQDAFATSIADDGSVWNQRSAKPQRQPKPKRDVCIQLDRFRYDGFANDFDDDIKTDMRWTSRLAWLDMQPKAWRDRDFRPQPFTQCAKALRGMGHVDAARNILCEREWRRLKRYDAGLFERFWGTLIGLVAGHGYKTGRALFALVPIWLIGVFVFSAAYVEGRMRPASDNVLANEPYLSHQVLPADYEPFEPMIYSADVLLPIVDFSQERLWLPRDGFEASVPMPPLSEIAPRQRWESIPVLGRWIGQQGWIPKLYYWFEIAAGWFLTTIAVAGFSGLLGHNRDN